MNTKRMTVGELVMAFCDLPNHQQMLDAFVYSNGNYDCGDFLSDFQCPEWAYEFLFVYCYGPVFADVA